MIDVVQFISAMLLLLTIVGWVGATLWLFVDAFSSARTARHRNDVAKFESHMRDIGRAPLWPVYLVHDWWVMSREYRERKRELNA